MSLFAKLILLITGLFFFGNDASGQDLDFIKRLNTARTDTVRVSIYKEAIRHYSRRNADSVKYYGELAIAYFRRHKEPLFEAQVMEQMALVDDNQGRTNTAHERTQYALNIYRQLNYKPGIASAVGNMGALEASMGNYEEALKYMIESLKLSDTTMDRDVVITGYMNLATVYLSINDLPNAEKYFGLATNAAVGHKVTDKIISLYNLVGVMYAMKGDNERALKTFQQNMELSANHEFINSHLECITYISQYYIENNQPDKALTYLHTGLELATTNNIAEIRSNILQQMGAIVADSDPKQAEKYLNEALAIATSMGNKLVMMVIYESLASLHKKTGNYKDALQAAEKRHKLSDSILSTNKKAEISGLLATWELEKSNDVLADLELKQAKHIAQRNMFGAIAIGVLVVLIILVLFVRRMLLLNKKLKAHEASLEQMNAMKDKLFSIIAHDMRGPVGRIPVILDIYEDPDTAPEEKKYLMDSIRSHTHDLIDMLEKLLMWGQSLMKGVLLQQQSVSVDTCIRQDLSLSTLALAEKKLQVDYLHDETARVVADPMHLDFIVRNLLANAIKYSRNGGTVSIRIHHDMKPGYVVISVKDGGVGIPPDRLPMIFHPISSTPGTQNEKGTGIGLMLCREFTLLNGGEIWVESEPDKGATFYLAFKAAD